MSYDLSRRLFFSSLTGMVAAPLAAQTPAPTWDLSWLDQLKGKHKQVFDLGTVNLGELSPLRQANNYLNTFRDTFHVEPPDVNVAIGIARDAFPINASDALWDTFKIGEQWKITDPATGKPARRNIFLGPATGPNAPTIHSLMARGAIFWQCNIALGAVVTDFSKQTGIPADKVRADVVAGLNPGVKLVPAHALLVGLVQERGFTYMRP